MFDETDDTRKELLKKGVRHDITGDDHPVLKSGPGEDDFDLIRGIPRTVDDDTARKHYQEKHEAGRSKYDGEEMLRRYRFSVLVSKMTEALYRRGYDLERDFRNKVKACN